MSHLTAERRQRCERLIALYPEKRSALIPLCHIVPLTKIAVTATLRRDGVAVESAINCTDRTGVEMEALTAVSVALLTVYDMCKSVDKVMTITEIRLDEKTGGKSGSFVR